MTTATHTSAPASPLRHAGIAARAKRRLLWRPLALLLAGSGAGLGVWLGARFLALPALGLAALGLALAWFTWFFFRDPDPCVPAAVDVLVAPAHGTVDTVEETVESGILNGQCRRISIFLSVMDVHVQHAPAAGTVVCCRRQPGQFLSALKAESARRNENVLIEIQLADRPGERLAVRQIAGVIARRVVTWVRPGDQIARGERIGLIQFGSRCDLYLPLAWRLTVKRGDKVKGGETIVARRREPASSAAAVPAQARP